MFFYQVMSTFRHDVVAQKLGIVMIAYTVGRNVFSTWQHSKDILQLPVFRECLPYREAAFHFCYNSTAIQTVISIQQKLSNKEHRVRFRSHYGTFQFRFAQLQKMKK